MHVVQDAFNSSDLPRGGVATIGNFDGVHRGQKVILDQVVARAEELGAPAVVITFDPHPLTVLAPDRTPVPLTTPKQKEALLAEAGVTHMLVVRFTPELARVPARSFVSGFLHEKLRLRAIYVGKGFVFGQGRQGNLDLLEEMGKELGFTAHGVDEVVHGGERISSASGGRSARAKSGRRRRCWAGRTRSREPSPVATGWGRSWAGRRSTSCRTTS
jgi:riboflavin kinase/FMN adenylyltransferase